MKLTKRKALEISKELWTWLAETGEEFKQDWPGWKKYGKMIHYCPCCEYVGQQGKYSIDRTLCEGCPLIELWPDDCELDHGDDYAYNFDDDDDKTAWENWNYADSAEDRNKYAALIVDGCDEALAALPKEKS